MGKRKHCKACEMDYVPDRECYPIATCGCHICEDIVADEEGYPVYRPNDLKQFTEVW